jgi:hypothetical protein
MVLDINVLRPRVVNGIFCPSKSTLVVDMQYDRVAHNRIVSNIG